MNRASHLSTAVLILLLLGMDHAEAEDKNEAKDILGKWKVVEMHVRGAKNPPPREMLITFEQDKVIRKFGGADRDGKYKIDTKQTPHHIDMLDERNGQERITKMIFRVDKESLELCGGRPGGERPKEFKGDGDKVLMIMKRVTQDEPGGPPQGSD